MRPRPGAEVTIRALGTDELSAREVSVLRALFDAAWAGADGAFSETDWRSATGGVHLLAELAGEVVSHASIVDRVLESGGVALATGYVEAVATAPEHRGSGYASRVMRAVGDLLDDRFELGALDTGLEGFYERWGWERWRGPTMVRTERGVIGTPEEDGTVMVRRTPRSPVTLDLDAPISCEWRPGDVW